MNIEKNALINKDLYTDIAAILHKAHHETFKAVNFFMVDAYWNIGKRIIDEEQNGEKRAEYGAYLLRNLAKLLTTEFGSGFSERSLRNMRHFYIYGETLLMWSSCIFYKKIRCYLKNYSTLI